LYWWCGGIFTGGGIKQDSNVFFCRRLGHGDFLMLGKRLGRAL
jgi:hypothetical protein